MMQTVYRFFWLVLALSTSHTVAAEPKTEETDIPAGHSSHGEAFNEGPRQKAYLMGGTGPIHFDVSSSVPQVKEFINQGIGQLHGYWYFEAERSFRQAAQLDPNCAIAYWGMALANSRNSTRAKSFLKEAVKRKEHASPREQMYIDALDEYTNGKGSKKEKATKYVKAYEDIIKGHPDDLEARAFRAYALYKYRSTLGKKYEDVDKAIGEVLAKEPMHSVHHFRIHLWDTKDSKKALASSALCGQGSPSIAHMWHMPGHIYSRLKRYEDAVYQQEASARVDHAHMMRDRVMPDQIHNFAHNNEWLIRNLVYLGRVEDALSLAVNMISLPQHPKYNTLKKRGSHSYGRTRLYDIVTQYELWPEFIRLAETHLDPTEEEAHRLARSRHLAVAYASTGRTAEAEKILADLEEELKTKKAQVLREKIEAAKKKAIEDAKKKALEAKKNEGDKKDEDDKKDQDDKKKPTRRPSRRKKDPTAAVQAAINHVKGAIALHAKDYKKAYSFLKLANSDRFQRTRVQALAGQTEPAITAAEANLKSRPNQVLPLATLVEIYWIAEDKKNAKKTFDLLRKISGSIQFSAPIFERLRPIAKELGYPDDWRVQQSVAKDIGKRPPLDELGPFRWKPSPAKSWRLQDADGQIISLDDYKGKPVIVIFYLGYGCLHCAEQLEAFAPMTEKFKAAGIELVAISTDDLQGLKQSHANYKKGTFPFPLVSDAKLDVFKAYRAYDDFEQIPLHGTFLVDSEGLVRWQDISFEPFMDAEFLLKESQRLLKQASPTSVKTLKPLTKDPAE